MATTRTISSGGTSANLGTSTLSTNITFIQQGNSLPIDLPPLFFDASPCAAYLFSVTTGNNTLTLNPSTRCLIIVPPTGNTVALKYDTSGDTSWVQNNYGWAVMTFQSAQANININAGADLADLQVYEL